MQVVEHCYEENSRLSNLTARLTRSLADAKEQCNGPNAPTSPIEWLPGDEQEPKSCKEDKYLKQIADLHFTVLRLKKQLQELGVETQDDSNSEGEEDEGEQYFEMEDPGLPT
jgi:hypothetical protein